MLFVHSDLVVLFVKPSSRRDAIPKNNFALCVAHYLNFPYVAYVSSFKLQSFDILIEGPLYIFSLIPSVVS